MARLRVVQSINNSFVHRNQVVYSEEDFPERPKFLCLNGIPFPAVAAAAEMKKGTVGIGLLIRIHLNLTFTDDVDTVPWDNREHPESTLTQFEVIGLNNRRKLTHCFDEKKMVETIREWFHGYPLTKTHRLIFQMDGISLTLVCHSTGWLTERTVIEISSSHEQVVIAGDTLIKKRFFSSDFSFEEHGIGGLDEKMRDVFVKALSSRAFPPEIVEKMGIKHKKGLLLYGPPGTGKTLIARNIGAFLGTKNIRVVNGPELMNKYVGQSEKNVRDLFAEAEADQKSMGNLSPLHVIIFDEIDALCAKRGRDSTGARDGVVNQLLSKIDGVESLNNIFIIGMTNRKDILDPALIRKGRLDLHIPIGMPDEAGRLQILRIHTKKMMSHSMMDESVDLEHLARETTNFTGSELMSLVQDAANFAFHESIPRDEAPVVRMRHLIKALKEITPMMDEKDSSYEEIKIEEVDENGIVKRTERVIETLLEPKRIKLLVSGVTGSGKSYLLQQFHKKCNHDYRRLIHPQMLIGKTDGERNQLLVDYWFETRQYDRSLILIDDVESLLSYSSIGYSTHYHNPTYQTLVSIIKGNTSVHQVDLIIVVSDPALKELLGRMITEELTL